MIKKEVEGAAILSIYNELKDEIKAIRTDIQHLNIQQPKQAEENKDLNSLLKETIINAVNDTINTHIKSRESYADEVSRRCKNTIDFAIERETKLINNVLFAKLSPILQINKKIDTINERLNEIENDIQKKPQKYREYYQSQIPLYNINYYYLFLLGIWQFSFHRPVSKV